ncbi:MAG: hypothetical protein LBS11_10680 [Oscillospiraceae bacterium]|jgi:hypothetical protein|nr:hypothetical protein [Oscillospiraceae bacterium]
MGYDLRTEPTERVNPTTLRAFTRCALIAALVILALLDPATVTDAARRSCQTWAESVMPSLFPFVALSLLLVSSLNALNLPCTTLTSLSVALGMIGGSPSGARLLAQLQNQTGGKLSKRSIQRAAACVTTASPMFILATLTNWLGTSRFVGLTMLVSHILAALLAGLVCVSWTRRWPDDESTRYYSARDSARDTENQPPSPAKPLTLSEAVTQAAAAMFSVCGCMVLFNAAVAVAASRLALSPMAAAVMASLLEMAGGCARIAGLGLPTAAAAPMICAAVTFGGASVFTQNAAFLSKAGVRLPIQLAARAVGGLLAWSICAALLGNRLGWVVAAAALAVSSVPAIPDAPTRKPTPRGYPTTSPHASRPRARAPVISGPAC